MSGSLMHFSWCVIIAFSLCIDKGDGSWKKRDKEELKRDIAKFKEMAEKIEEEIEDFYDDYSNNWSEDEYLIQRQGNITAGHDSNGNKNKTDGPQFNLLNLFSQNMTNRSTDNTSTKIPIEPKAKEIGTEKALLTPKWPKFEDLLEGMGKKYDWKNDRWIKVKKKNVTKDSPVHEKHKFSYRTVKLNRSKSRRNIVIAVTAVR